MKKRSSIINAIYRFFSRMGDAILRFPNRAFYVVLTIMCIMAPIFAIIIAIALLCGIYRRSRGWPQ